MSAPVSTVSVVGLQELYESRNMMSMINSTMIQYGDFIFLKAAMFEILVSVQMSPGLMMVHCRILHDNKMSNPI